MTLYPPGFPPKYDWCTSNTILFGYLNWWAGYYVFLWDKVRSKPESRDVDMDTATSGRMRPCPHPHQERKKVNGCEKVCGYGYNNLWACSLGWSPFTTSKSCRQVTVRTERGLLHPYLQYDPITVELQLCQSQFAANKTCEHRKGDW